MHGITTIPAIEQLKVSLSVVDYYSAFRLLPAMHSWLIRDTPPKPQAPVSRLAANNVNASMPSLEAQAEDTADEAGKAPRRFASTLLLRSL